MGEEQTSPRDDLRILGVLSDLRVQEWGPRGPRIFPDESPSISPYLGQHVVPTLSAHICKPGLRQAHCGEA